MNFSIHESKCGKSHICQLSEIRIKKGHLSPLLSIDMRKALLSSLSLEIRKILDEKEIEAISKSCKLTTRKRKITAYQLVELILFEKENNFLLSLEDMSTELKKRYNVQVSKQAIDKKFSDGAVKCIRLILEKALSKTLIEDSYTLPLNFNQIRIKDSTSFKLPDTLKVFYPGAGGRGNASKATIKIQFEFDIKTGKIIELAIVPFLLTDQANAKETIETIQKDDLIIRDLGYFSLGVLEKIITKEAWFLSRLDTNTNIYELKKGKFYEVDFKKIENKMKRYGLAYYEMDIYVGELKKVQCRVVILPLPPEVKNERLRNYYAKYGNTDGIRKKKYIIRAGLNIFITNVKDIKAENIRHIYAIRWQIELIFKGWKSIAQIDKIRKMKIQRFEFMLYTRFIWLIINWKIIYNSDLFVYTHYKESLSHYVLLKYQNRYKQEFCQAIQQGTKQLENYLNDFFEFILKKGKRTKNKKKVNLIDIYNLLLKKVG